MTKIEKIQKQILWLLKAENYLLKQTPSDMIVIEQITEKIDSLEARQSALSRKTIIPTLTNNQVEKLESAIHELDAQIRASKTASDILVAATAVAKSA